MQAQVLLIERIESEMDGASFAARCHSGTLRVGDSLSIAIDPAGLRHQVDVKCTEIRLMKRIIVEELEENFGGLIVLRGADSSKLKADWVLVEE